MGDQETATTAAVASEDVPQRKGPKTRVRRRMTNERRRQLEIGRSEREEQEMMKRIQKTVKAGASKTPFSRLSFALLINLIMLVVGVTFYFRPDLFFEKKRRQYPARSLAMYYPIGISPRSDLPYFFKTYAIVTDRNAHTRYALHQLIQIRRSLSDYSVSVSPWERFEVLQNPNIELYCGDGFLEVYSAAHRYDVSHSEDLLLWCLLYAQNHDGFFKWNLTMTTHPKVDRGKKGVVGRYVGQVNRAHSAFVWLPKLNGTVDSLLPRHILRWLLLEAPEGKDKYLKLYEEYLYQQILLEEEKWMWLDVDCDSSVNITTPEFDPSSKKRIASHCTSDNNCCTMYL